MANNLYINKVDYSGRTLIDLTEDTVTPSDVLNGATFHDRSGTPQTGGLIVNSVYDGLDSTSADDALSAKQGKNLNDGITALSNNVAPVSFTVSGGTTVTKQFTSPTILVTGHNTVATLRGLYYLLGKSSIATLINASDISVSVNNGNVTITNNASATCNCALIR